MLGAAIGAAGSLASSAFQARHARKSSSKARAFSERMANTQYQRAVKDMRKAGINPMLAAKVGGNAVPPSPQAPGISPGNPGASAVEGHQRSQQSKLLKQQIDQSESSEALNKAQALKVVQEARLTGANADKAEVTKGLYQGLLPVIEDAQKWMNSAYKSKSSLGTKKGSGGFIQNLMDSLFNGADPATKYLSPDQKRQRNKYKMKGGSGGKGYRLPAIEVGPND